MIKTTGIVIGLLLYPKFESHWRRLFYTQQRGSFLFPDRQ